MTERFASIAAISQESTISGVLDRAQRHAVRLGYPCYTLGTLPQGPDYLPPDFTFHNMPEIWVRTYIDRDYARTDPTVRHATTSARPVTFGQLIRGQGCGPLSDDEQAMLAFARSIGRGHGAVVPLFGLQGYRAICCFYGPSPDPDAPKLAELSLLAITTHQRLSELHGAKQARAARRKAAITGPTLSDRERDVMTAARDGLTNAEIGVRLGISTRTVRFHIDNARVKLSASNRTTAVVTAVNLHLL